MKKPASESLEVAEKLNARWATEAIERACEECQCGHARHRHVGCDAHPECCDEHACPCTAFVLMGRLDRKGACGR